MKIVFVSNYFNHHQKPLCDALYGLLGDGFSFIATESVPAARVKLGYAKDASPRYVCQAHLDPDTRLRAMELINGADAVIAGSAPAEYLSERLRMGKLVLRYSERPYKKKPSILKRIYHAFRFRLRDHGNRNVYMLCASAYTAADFRSIGMYRDRMYKWGYFPEVKALDIESVLDRKSKNTILWCGRFLDWKHPDEAIRLAGKLKAEGYDFRLNMIGIGKMEPQLKHMAEACGVADAVTFLGSMSPEQVRTYMEEAGIFLFTSDRQEGWGAVLNEAMASGCAVVGSSSIGSVPYLIRHMENGFVYSSGDMDGLFENVKQLLEHPGEQSRLGKMAYNSIVSEWNAEVAANRLIMLSEEILKYRNRPDLFISGPCSKAEIYRDK